MTESALPEGISLPKPFPRLVNPRKNDYSQARSRDARKTAKGISCNASVQMLAFEQHRKNNECPDKDTPNPNPTTEDM
ncbi:hypothetical protein ANFP_26510 [Acidithiobacillus ferrooxidans]|nr:hypothetical protein ANFP_26510 [Acidithiobacillus ferrooxidans]